MSNPIVTSPDGLHIGGVPVFEGDTGEFITELVRLSESGSPELVVTPNVDQVINLCDGEPFSRAYASARVAVLDGMPLVHLARALGGSTYERITGADLVDDVSRAAAEHQLRVALAGGASGVAQKAASELCKSTHADVVAIDFPMIGDVTDPVSREAITALRSANADIVFLCLGSPKQELWFHEWRGELPPAVYVGAGAAVDFAAGRAQRAPRAVQSLSLEWAWRLIQEPNRLWKRYLVKGPRFIGIALRALRENSGSRADSEAA